MSCREFQRGMLERPMALTLTTGGVVVLPRGCIIEYRSLDEWPHDCQDQDIQDGAELLAEIRVER